MGERSIFGVDFVQETTEKIRVVKLNMKEVQDRQKSYADRRRKELEFVVGDRVYFKMAMMRGLNRFISEDKLSTRYMGSFRVVERVGLVVYRLELFSIMEKFYDVFYVSKFRRCLYVSEEVAVTISADFQSNLTVGMRSVRIFERSIKVLRRKRVPLLRVLWDCDGIQEEIWESEAKMKTKFKKWFEKQAEE